MGDSVNRIESFENIQEEISVNVQNRVSSKIIEIINHIQDHAVNSHTHKVTHRIDQEDLVKTVENGPLSTCFTMNSENETLINLPQTVECFSIPKQENDHNTTDILLNNGFVVLAEQLLDKFGSPWDKVLELDNPLQIEQLYDLINIIELKSTEIERENFSKCLQNAIKIANKTEHSPNEKIGKLIFLIDHAPELVVNQSKMQTRRFVEWIDNTFDGYLENKITELEKYCRRHRKGGIQQPDVAYRNQLPIEISRFLISSTGNINTGLIDVLIETFIEDLESPLNYEKILLNNLIQLKSLPTLRELVNHILAPTHTRAPANIIIRTTMGLAPNKEITDLDAKQTAIAALLTANRQGRDGSCFATPLAIYLLNHHQDMCLNDFCQILSSSKLIKNVNGSVVDFPFLLHIGDQNLNQSIKLNSSGTHLINNGKLYSLNKIPGFRAVKQVLGIKKIKITKHLSTPKVKNKEYTITIKDIIYALVKQAQKLPVNKEKRIPELMIHAVFAYEAQECNPLLKMWENTIACMAEADEHSMVRSEIINSVKNVISHFLEQSEWLPDFKQQFLSLFIDTLNEKMHLQWDPKISDSLLSRDQKSTEGAFILYDKGVFNNPSKWERIDNPYLFQCFIKRTIYDVIEEHHAKSSEEWNSIFNSLIEYIDSDFFLSDSLCDYHSHNCGCNDPIRNYKHLRFTPWATKSGNNLEKVIQVYFEQPHLRACRHLNPLNGEQLLEQFILLIDEIAHFDGQRSCLHTQSIPVRIPYVHAFTLLIGHPTLAQSLGKLSNRDLFANLHSSLTNVGNQISNYEVSRKLKTKIIKQVKNSVIHSTKRKKFERCVHQLPTLLTVQELRQSLLAILSEIQPSNSRQQREIALQVDDLVYQSLSSTLKRKLAMSAIHFADSNWAEGIHAIHLCLVVNPCTGCIEVWGSKDDQSELYPLDQSIWFENGDWEIFTNFLD